MKHYNAHGVIHRDIKPENIMVGVDGCARFCDFGVAKMVTTENSLRTDVGTDCYKAPEVFLQQYDEKCDIWGLGTVLY
jgi:serine/threonine protein kinase